MEPKKLYRVDEGKILAGVCGGIAEFIRIDPNIVRLLWCVLSIFSAGAGILIYVVAALILPHKSDLYPE